MSTVSIFGAAAVLRASEAGVFGVAGTAGAIVDDGEVVLGVVVVAGWANTGPAIVKANSPKGSRENFNIFISNIGGNYAVELQNGEIRKFFLQRPNNFLRKFFALGGIKLQLQ
jgi:hypothetical protein